MKLLQNNDSAVLKETEQKIEDQKVTLSLTDKVLFIMRDKRIDLNQLFTLIALYDGQIGLLDIYDANSSNKKILIMDYQALQIHGLIEEGEGDTLYQISEAGKELVERLKPLMGVSVEVEKEDKESLRKLCEEYLLIFPNMKLPSGKAARVNIVDIEKKMSSWLKVYKPAIKKNYGLRITNEDILQATRNYVERFSKTNYNYMVTSLYFIQKKDVSALADEILALKQGGMGQGKSNIVVG